MRKTFSLLFIMLSIMLSAFAKQTTTTVKGVVNDDKGKPLATATVVLHKAKDSALVKTDVTDASGKFSFTNIAAGKYFVEVSNVGFNNYNSAAFDVAEGQQYELPAAALAAASKELGGVVVKAKKPMIEVKADKTVFNVEQSINAQGSNALELLQKSPGVQVDNNDNISMKGKTGVRIYVDGRMMQLDTKDLAAYLKSINSNDIESIEMISNPSAKYDASGNAGIVNIKLKKNKKYGTNGSVNLGYVQGVTPKGNGSVNLNYRDKKINLFGNVGGNIGKYENKMSLYRRQNDTIYDQHSTNWNNEKSSNIKAGADLFLNSRNTIGVIATANFSNNGQQSSASTDIYNAQNNTYVKTLRATNAIPQSRTNANFNANYRYADTSGREINVDADYGLFRGTGRSYQPNIYVGSNGQVLNQFTYRNYTPTDINIYTVKADLSQKLWKGVFGYGAKFSYVKTKNTFDFFNEINNKPELDMNRSNRFAYTENVNAAYVNYNRQLNEKWSVQGGLRLEQTNSEGDLTRADGQVQQDGNIKRHYLDLFPSAAISWNINPKNALNLTYSRRIDRPTYQDLNPFENKLDELTYEKGNAFLRPQYTNNVELTHTLLGMINTAVGYSYVKDFATQTTDTANRNATYIQQRNLASQQIWSASISSPLPITKWWNGYVNVWFNYQVYKGKFNNGTINEKIPGYGFYMQHAFNVTSKGTTAEISGWYNGPSIWGGTWRNKPMGGFDIGLQQPLLKNKASIKISMTDVTFNQYWRAVSDFGGLYVRGRGSWESRTFRVNFTYRFGSNEVKEARQRKTGLESEAGRIKGK